MAHRPPLVINIKPKPPQPHRPRKLIEKQDRGREHIPGRSRPGPEQQRRFPSPGLGLCDLVGAFREGLGSDPVVGAEEGGAGDGRAVSREDDGYAGLVGVKGVALGRGAVGMRAYDCGRGVADLMLAREFRSRGQRDGLHEGDVLSSGCIADWLPYGVAGLCENWD